MLKRIITGLSLFIAFCFFIFYAPIYLFNALALLICLLVTREIVQMYALSTFKKFITYGVILLGCLGTYFTPYDFSNLIRILAISTWCFIVPFILIMKPQKFTFSALLLLLFLLIVPAFYSLFVLRAMFGPRELLFILMIAFFADTFAYFGGKLLGGKIFGARRLAPVISPNKTFEGLISGYIAVIIYLSVLNYLHCSLFIMNYKIAIKFAIVLATVSVLGDLLESWLKRVAHVKDSGGLLPGHGGIFDRMDSVLAVVAIAFSLCRGLF